MEQNKTLCHFCNRNISKNVKENDNYVFCEHCKTFTIKGNLKTRKNKDG